VVGTDGSDTSLRAVEHAAAFAAENNAKLIIRWRTCLMWTREAGEDQPGRIV
jgi:nucleotide-binding universal stress UspA family protein